MAFKLESIFLLAMTTSVLAIKNVEITEAPWLVSIQTHGVHYCSGAIIGTDWIVTSAQCIINDTISASITIRAGSSNRLNGGSVHKIYRQKRHESFKIGELWGMPINDIGLIQILDHFDFDDTRQPIKVNSSHLIDIKQFETTSWDVNKNDVESTMGVQKSNWSIIPTDECQEDVYYFDLPSDKFCTLSTDDKIKNKCTVNDLGYPMIINGYLGGFKSWKINCSTYREEFTLFTNIKNYLTWIDENTKINLEV